MEQIRKENKMGVEPVGSLLIKMSFPMMLSMLVMALYNVVDSVFVSRVSEDALTAVSLAFPFQMLITSVGVGTAVGVNSLVARRLGEGRQPDANCAASHGLYLALLSALVFTIAYIAFARPALALFAEGDIAVLDMSVSYLTICGGLCAFSMMAIMTEKILQGTGDTFHAMVIQLVGALTNIVLDPIMIFGYLGFPALGVAGAALATVIGQLVSMITGFYILFARNKLISIRIRGFRFRKETVGNIYRVGLPSIVMQAIGSVTTFGLNKILMMFSKTAVSVLGVYFKLQSFVFMPVFGLNSGAMPIMAFNYGARDKERVMKTLKLSALYALIIMCVGLALFQAIPDKFLLLFDASDHMLDIGTHAFRVISLCFPFAALGVMFSSLYQAVGIGIYSLLVSLARQLIVILPAAYVLAVTAGLDAVWFAYPIAECLSMIISAALVVFVYRKYIRNLQKTPETQEIA